MVSNPIILNASKPRRIFKLGLLPLACGLLMAAGVTSVQGAERVSPSQTAYGGVGYVTMPSARMHRDGDFGVHLSRIEPYNQFVVFGQPAPWLEVLFKYTDIDNRIYGISNQGYKDKSFDAKLRLLAESYYWPEIAVGVRDIGGTGLFSGEYVVASKQWGRFDASLGFGWGYLGQQGQLSNPFKRLGNNFARRERNDSGEGGEFNLDSYFSGDRTSVFAGLAYQMAAWPLVLKLDYDANDYQNEPLRNRFKQSSPINVAGVYSFGNGFDVHLGWARGDTVMLGLTLRTSLVQPIAPKLFDMAPEPILITPVGEVTSLDWPALSEALHTQAGFVVSKVAVDSSSDTLRITGSQTNYNDLNQGVGRVSRMVHNRLASDEVKHLEVVEQTVGLTLSVARLSRDAFVDLAELVATPESTVLRVSGSLEPSESLEQTLYQAEPEPLSFSLLPALSANIGGPDEFVLYQLSLRALAHYHFDQQQRHSLNLGLELGLLDNFDQFEYEASSNLPRVRTQIRDYLKTSKLRMSQFYAASHAQPTDDLFWLGYGGYLESMYAGVGSELLYRPFGKNWALGVDANFVQQRAFDQGFGLRDYQVLTGHVTGYYEWQQVLIQLSAGQYLAKDRGVTFDVSRRFLNNARLGAWASRTNVSAEDFGEGSFDKGVYVVIPFDMFSLKSTRETGRVNFQFLTRDGGQKLNRPQQLYGITDKRRYQYYSRPASLLD